LKEIQDRLITWETILATDCADCNVKIPEMYDSDVVMLGKEIDRCNQEFHTWTYFILSGGLSMVIYCSLACTIFRW